jgi:tRNA uridine 5-carboxymethylaminomethyl modification enzyme
MQREIDEETERLAETYVQGASLKQWLCRPGVSYDTMPGARLQLHADVREQVEVFCRYEGYICRDIQRISRSEALERKRIPSDTEYAAIKGLRREAVEKLLRVRPETLGQASRISGVNPADVAILSIHLHK